MGKINKQFLDDVFNRYTQSSFIYHDLKTAVNSSLTRVGSGPASRMFREYRWITSKIESRGKILLVSENSKWQWLSWKSAGPNKLYKWTLNPLSTTWLCGKEDNEILN